MDASPSIASCGTKEDHADEPGNEMPENSNSSHHKEADKPPAGLSKRAQKRMLRFEARKKSREVATAKKNRKADENKDLLDGDVLNETSYYIENGLRKVYPYYFTFSTFAKRRWLGTSILEIFQTEFRHYPPEVFRQKLANGSVCINHTPVKHDYKLKDNDFLSHRAHRHEVPVTAQPIEIVVDNDEFAVVNKPSSIPCHPCGSFRHNSLIYILAKEYGLQNLRSFHRLDRLTSGLVVYAKTEAKARQMHEAMRARLVQKEYLARVVGHFPSEPVECCEPLDILCHKMGLQKVTPSGKDAKTTFTLLNYNGKSSVVKCAPHTGRTHQIRVHLQFLGFPIINDPLYNTSHWGPLRGKGGDFGKTEQQLIEELLKEHDRLKFINPDALSDGLPSASEDATRPVHGGDSLPRTTSGEANDVTSDAETHGLLPDRRHSGTEGPGAQAAHVAERQCGSCLSDQFNGSGTSGNGIDGSGATGSGAGCDANGSGDTGNGDITGSGITGSGITGSGITGSGDTGNGNITGSGITGSCITGNGITGRDITGSDITGRDITESDITGSDITGSDITGSDVTESGAHQPGSASVTPGLPETAIASSNIKRRLVSAPGICGPDTDAAPCKRHKQDVDCAADSPAARRGAASLAGPDPSLLVVDSECPDCLRKFKDPLPHELVMYLHAYRYTGPDWEFCTALPEWAAEDWPE